MEAFNCRHCNWLVAPSASRCRQCDALVRDAKPLPPVAPPAGASLVVKAIGAVGAGAVVLAFLNLGKGNVVTDVLLHGPSLVPQTGALASERILISECRHDWRSCFDNRDWVENVDRTAPRSACLALAGATEAYGQIALDRSWRGSRFDSYVPGMSIRRGHIVLVDRAGLVRDVSGGWVRASLHCTFDFGSWRARSVIPL